MPRVGRGRPPFPVFRGLKGAWLGAPPEESEAVIPYALRHQYITDALARGVAIAIVAEVTGTSSEMIAKVYSHISEKKGLLLEVMNQIRQS